MTPYLSICILTIARRREKLLALHERLFAQCGGSRNARHMVDYTDAETHLERYIFGDVEILTYCTKTWDRVDHSVSVSSKRNFLIDKARGEFVSFIDDDDQISDSYVSSIVDIIRSDALSDVVTFKSRVFLPGKPAGLCIYGPFGENRNIESPSGAVYERLPNHICAWRRSLCLPYTPGIPGEDSEWAGRMKSAHPNVVFAHVDDVLYEYHWNPNDSVQTVKPAYLRKPGPG
jgi:hypothetical protein